MTTTEKSRICALGVVGVYALYKLYKTLERSTKMSVRLEDRSLSSTPASSTTDLKTRSLCKIHKTILHVDCERVFIVDTAEKWDKCVDALTEGLNTIKLLGLDSEWVTRDGRMQPVSMLQLASLNGVCVLVRLHQMSEMPASLRAILADRRILKAGVAVCDDAVKLFKSHGLEVNGCVDLVHLVMRARLDSRSEKGARSLQGVALQALGVALDKDPYVRRSDWERPVLSQKQIEYAAKDALVGAFAFWRLISLKLHSERFFCEKTTANWSKALSCCQGIIDIPFKHVRGDRKPRSSRTVKNIENNPAKAHNMTRAYVARKSPLYDHCTLLAPDGQLLCTCDSKKAQWYIDKGLGVKVGDDPLRVQLTFEPSGRPIDEQNYYTQDKLNICVVCGASGTYIRKSIIPHEYRKYFPQVMKEHRSHDVLLMCLPCHQRSNLHDAVLKEKLASQCGAPLDAGEYGKYKRDHIIHKVKSAAKALLLNGKSIPESRKEKLAQLLKDYFCTNFVDEELLKHAIDLDPKVEADDFIPHGQKIYRYWKDKQNGLVEFEKMVRQHFLDSMSPKFLPPGWSVDFRHSELESMQSGLTSMAQAVAALVEELLLA